MTAKFNTLKGTPRTAKVTGTFNGKDISELDSAATTDLIVAILAHRKNLNAARRAENAKAKTVRKAKAARTAAESLKRAEDRLAKAKARAAKLSVS